MSYKPTPKTSYGDTDFSDDSWSPQGTGVNQPLPAPPMPSYYGAPPQPLPPQPYPGVSHRGSAAASVSQLPYSPGQTMNPQYANPMQQGQAGQPTNSLASVANSITQEDILFMRSWQRDSFYYRVIPCEVLGLGSLYMINKTKNFPHSISRYMGMAFVTFMIGKWSYRGEFKRRLAESPSNTPYMQALRRTLGITSTASSEFTTDPDYGGNNEFDQWNSGAGGSAFQPATYTDNRQFGSVGSQITSYDLPASDRLDNQTNDELVKPRVTYDELRARNRGFIK